MALFKLAVALIVIVTAITNSGIASSPSSITTQLILPLRVDDFEIRQATSRITRVAEGPATPPNGTPSQPADEAAKSPQNEKNGEKKENTPTKETTPSLVVTRPSTPEKSPNPLELEMTPNPAGMVRFNFSGQPWPAVIEWLARVSNMSLDWQELPNDHLNLITQREYTLPEARNVINRHLLARGFTLLQNDELLTVVSIAKLNVSMVPRVDPDDLAQRLDAEFVKVSFPLRSLLAEKAVEELKPMLSANGKLTPLKEINRVEAMDSVGNLRDIYQVLQQSQSEETTKTTIVREFRLEYRRAADVVLLVEAILGLEPKRPAPQIGGESGGDMMSFQMMQQMQQMQQMLQQSQQAANSGGKVKEAEPRLIVNGNENSILAHATPDKMEIITQTIKAIDVAGSDVSGLDRNINHVKPYRLSTAAPGPIVSILKEMGQLSPQSRIQVDDKTKSIILYGNIADHYTTQELIKRLDGANRSFEVVRLRRLKADAVAGTIHYLMGGEEEKKSSNNNRYSYFGYDPFGGQSSTAKQDQRPFKVDADIVNNRLLLWANESELKEVDALLIKMGEIPPGTKNLETQRAIDLHSDEEAARVIEQLKSVWPNLEPAPLQFQPSPVLQPKPEAITPVKPPAVTSQPTPPLFNNIVWQNEIASPSEPHPLLAGEDGLSPATPGISIRILPNGRLILNSPDTDSLDRLEDLITELAPPLKDYHVFHLKYPSTWAFGIETILKDFFKDESLTESTYDPWYGTTKTTRTNRSQRLSNQRELKIISNDDSHTVLVQGATPEQLMVIQELIDVYDTPSTNDPQSVRKTEIFHLEYSKATAVAEAVKQVYRDLLSSNDPALQNNNAQQKPPEDQKVSYIFGRQNQEETKEESPAQPIRFKGLLSVGVDEISNSIIVSSTDGLMHDIKALIKQLDLAARPSHTIQVLQVHNVSPEMIQQRLKSSFASPIVRSSETGKKPENQHPLSESPPQTPPK
ncbi:secretin N-terminal domain-containing protein [Planctomicrobium sp. SH668]|uniref:secretin N-terminal domain-containing protein n=1 Tax=Planctomicrobium sp. SH668 TaxID=3448126 RepID=UPI003F5CAA2E